MNYKGIHKIVVKDWGTEEWIVNDVYCSKKITVYEQWSSHGRFHFHQKKDETFYVLSGLLVVELKNIGSMYLSRGESVRIKPGEQHRFKSVYGKCQFLEFSTHHEDSDTRYD